jgi:GAF domain-containing protein/HAMP domain-containing protein
MMWIQSLANFFLTSLQRKLILVMTLVVTLAMIAFGAYLVNTQRQTATAELTSRATRTVDLFAQTISLPLWNVDTDSMQAQIDAIMADPEVHAVRIIDIGKTEPKVIKAREEAAVELITRKAEIIFRRGEERIPLGTVEIDYTRALLNRSLAQTRLLVIIIILSLILVQVLGIYLLVGRLVTKPLHQITALTSRVALGDYTGQANLKSRDEMNILATAFNSMTNELRQTLEGLEQRVKERTVDLERANQETTQRAKTLRTIAEISNTVTSLDSLDELLPKITQRTSEALGVYHTGIFMVDANGEYAVLRAANSAGGQKMLARGHRLKVGQVGIVGYVSGSGIARIALDVGKDAVFFNNPDLPETRSELALPLKLRGKTVGVLDVQSVERAAFTSEDIDTLSLLAGQIAITIQNARLFEETERALLEAQTIYGQSARSSWREFASRGVLGFQYAGGNISTLKPLEKATAKQTGLGAKLMEAETLSIPISVHGDQLGVLNIRQPERSNAWSESEIRLYQSIVERLSFALENARLIEETAKNAERDRTITKIGDKLSASTQVEAILRTAAEELSRALKGSEVLVQLQPKASKDGQ